MSVDPLTQGYPSLTPFQFASNSPIIAIDLDGLEAEVTAIIAATESMRKALSIAMSQVTQSPQENPKLWLNYILALKHFDAVEGAIETGTVPGQVEGLLNHTTGAYVDFKKIKTTDDVKQYFTTYFPVVNGSGDAQFVQTIGTLLYKSFAENDAKAFGQLVGMGASLAGAMYLPKAIGPNDILEIQIAKTADEIAYLDHVGGDATYWSTGEKTGFMLVREGVTRTAILEEYIHHNQKLQYGEAEFLKNQVQFEIEAQDMLLKIGKEEKWSAEELARISRAKEAWQKKLDKTNNTNNNGRTN